MAQDNDVTYVFEDDKCIALTSSGKVLASATSIDEVDVILAEPEEVLPKSATHIVSPNGLKGQILGRIKDVWGEEVTVRFENGRIASFHTSADDDYDFRIEEPEVAASPADELEVILDQNFSADHDSLVERLDALKDVERKAAAAKASDYDEQLRYDTIAVTAHHEAEEVSSVLAAYQDQERIEPPAPFRMQAVEQEAVGSGDSTWLDHTLGEMIAESEATDYDKLMDEGPEALVAEMEDGALVDSGSVRSIASSYIRSKTVGIEEKAVGEYETAFLKRVEQVRRQELMDRKAKIAKQAATEQEDHDGPAEGLFI